MAYFKTKRRSAQAILFAMTIALGINTALAVPEEQWPSTASPSAIKVNDDAGDTHYDSNPVIANTSDGNFVVAWIDQRNGNQDIYIQKISSTDGSDLWSSSDVVVTNAAGPQPAQSGPADNNIEIDSDSNGTIVAFDSDTGPATPSDIFIQKINSSGSAQWTANGVQLSTDGTLASNGEFGPRLLLDGSGGAFVAWTGVDNVFGSSRAWVAHINSGGTIDQGPTELAHSGSNYDIVQDIITDGSGGVIVTYSNTDLGSTATIYSIKLDSSLSPVAGWNSGNPVAASDVGELPIGFTVAKTLPDSSGGIIVAYMNVTTADLKAQRISSTGTELWGSGTSTTIVSGSFDDSIDLISDGSGGIVAVWNDDRAFNTDVYAQRVNSSGVIQWTANGVPVSDETDNRNDTADSRAASHTAEGSTLIGFMGNGLSDARLQKLDSSGTKQYGAGGLNLDSGSVIDSIHIASDNNQGAGVTWHKEDTNADIYAQYVADPPPGSAPDAVTDLSTVSDDGQVTLNWTEPNDNGSAITGYTVEYGTVASGLFNNTCVSASCTDATAGAVITGLTNLTEYQFRIYATNANGTGSVSNVATATPTACGILADNDDSGGPTVSEACIGVTITAGTISFEDVPDSFSFPNKFSSSFPQDSFSNDDPGTGVVDVESETDDILTVADLRNTGGFDVTITSSVFINDNQDEIPLENLYIATSCPDGDDLTADLYGSPTNCDNTNGVEFADGSTDIANMNQASTVHSDNVNGTANNSSELTTLINAYTTDGANFDANLDDTPDTITLMESTSARLARISQALNFYLSLPANQASGTYSVLFTIDLLPN